MRNRRKAPLFRLDSQDRRRNRELAVDLGSYARKSSNAKNPMIQSNLSRQPIWNLVVAYVLIKGLGLIRREPGLAAAAQPASRAIDRGPGPRSAEPAHGFSGWWHLFRDAALRWSDHKAARLGAALAYYSVFSIGPLMLIAIAVAGLFFGADAVRGQVSAQLSGLLGETGAKAVETMLAGASQRQQGILATIIGIVTLLLGATGVVVQLKDALNTVWEAEAAGGSGVWGFARTYIVSLAGVLALGFLLLISLLLTTALSAGAGLFASFLPEGVLQVFSFLLGFAMASVLFAMMFKWLPDEEISWHDVWLGGVVTAVLFEIGKFLIGLYIGKQGLESTFGAASSIVVLLIWVYYSAQIVLYGAEFTYVYAANYGSRRDSGQRAKDRTARPQD
jgi:membrane protein